MWRNLTDIPSYFKTTAIWCLSRRFWIEGTFPLVGAWCTHISYMAKHTARTRNRSGTSPLVWLVLCIEWSLLKVTKSVCGDLCVRDDHTCCGQQVGKCAAQRYTSGAFAQSLSLSSFLRVSGTVPSAPLRSVWQTYSVLYSAVVFTSAVSSASQRTLSSLRRQMTCAVRHVKCPLRVLYPFETHLILRFQQNSRYQVPHTYAQLFRIDQCFPTSVRPRPGQFFFS